MLGMPRFRIRCMRLRACLGGLRLHQTNSGAATPPICSSIVELDSPFGAEAMCLAEATTLAPKIDSLNGLPSFALNFFVLLACVVCVCPVCACVCTCAWCVHAWCLHAVCMVCECCVHGCACVRTWVCTGAWVCAWVCAWCVVCCVRATCVCACVRGVFF
jgi:hypothetical protein